MDDKLKKTKELAHFTEQVAEYIRPALNPNGYILITQAADDQSIVCLTSNIPKESLLHVLNQLVTEEPVYKKKSKP